MIYELLLKHFNVSRVILMKKEKKIVRVSVDQEMVEVDEVKDGFW